MHSRRRSRILRRLLEQPHRPRAEKRQQPRPAENVDIGLQHRLPHYHPIQQPHRTRPPAAGPSWWLRYAAIPPTRCCNIGSHGDKCAPISVWCSAARRISAVVAIAMPIDPPMLRSMLKRPVALPISSRASVEVVIVASGTNTKLSENPVNMIGISSVYGPMSRSTSPKIIEQTRNPEIPGKQFARIESRPEHPHRQRPDERPDAARPHHQPAFNAV